MSKNLEYQIWFWNQLNAGINDPTKWNIQSPDLQGNRSIIPRNPSKLCSKSDR
eukprot:UN17778